MFKEIINKYDRFSDALISEIKYNSLENTREVTVTIKCMNSLNDFQWEIVKLIFTDIQFIRFIERIQTSSTFINSAMLKEEDNILIFDFFPLIFDGDKLAENAESDFLIKCKGVKYEVIK